MQTLYYDAPSNTSRRSSSYGVLLITTTVTILIVVVVVTVVLLVTTTVEILIVMIRRRRRKRREAKSCANISQNFLYCSLGYVYKHIGTRNFLTKALWVYSHLKSGFLFLQKVTSYSLT